MLLLLACAACGSEAIPIELDYEDGTPHFRATQVEGKFHGRYQRWWPNAQLAFEGDYEAGLLEGEWTQWHENGQVWRQATSRAGRLDGHLSEWDSSGIRIEDCEYREGRRHGRRVIWNVDGSRVESMWLHGFREGPERGFDTRGEVQNPGHLPRRAENFDSTWHANGRLASRVPLFEGRRHGEARTWFANGELRSVVDYVDDRRHGRLMRWYPDGTLAEQGRVEGNHKVGTWRVWKRDGSIDRERSGIFEAGERIAPPPED